MTISSTEMLDVIGKAGMQHKADVIHIFAGGSDLHGAKDGKGDLDIMGIWINDPVSILGIDREEHFTSGTSDQYVRNKLGDEDYRLYTLQRWAGLAAKGNPTILGFLYSPSTLEDTVWVTKILPNRELFLASSHASAFLGYGESQLHRMQGTRGRGKHGQRPELEEEFGFDTKAAMHMIRMMHECWEFLETGTITYPRPEVDDLISIRRGNWSKERIEREYLELAAKVKEVENNSVLPEHVNRKAISKVISEAYLAHWKYRGYVLK